MIHDPLSKERQMREGFDEIARSVPRWLGYQDRQDAIQDACLELLKIIEKQAVGSNLKALAGLIVRRKAARRLDEHRRDRRLIDACIEHGAMRQPAVFDPLYIVECNQNESSLHNAMHRLDDLERTVVDLRFMGELTYEQIVVKLALRDRNEVGTILRRAIKKLRLMLQSLE